VLHAEGDTCDVTQSGQRGLELALSGDYQAIILDLILPDLDGKAVLKKLRAANNKTPVLILSGVSDVAKKYPASSWVRTRCWKKPPHSTMFYVKSNPPLPGP